MLAEGHVGSALAAEGSVVEATFDRTKALRISEDGLHESLVGDVFHGSTVVTGVDHQASITTTAPLVLYNPVGSDVDLAVIGVSLGYVSGTLGAGFLAAAKYVVGTTNAVPTGTAAVVGSTRLGSQSPKATCLYTVTLTAGGTLICPLQDIAPKLATTAGMTSPAFIKPPVPIIVTPGIGLQLSGVCGAAGTSPLVVLSIFWREIKRLS